MKNFKKFLLLLAFVILLLNISCTQNDRPPENKSPAYMLSVIDGNTSEIYITRSQSLLKQVSNRYNITETEIGDRLVVLCHKILRDEYGINQTLQYTLEAINRIEISSPDIDDFN